MALRVAAVVVLLGLSTTSVHAQLAPLTVTSVSASVYKSPSIAAPVIGHVSRGDVLTVTRNVGDWVKIAWPADPGGIGYVRVAMGVRGRPATATGASASLAPAAPAQAAARPALGSTNSNATSSQSLGTLPVRRTVQPGVVAHPSHVVGLGARLLGPSLGIGGSLRAWSPGWLGLQVDFSRYSVTSAFAPESMSTTQFAPSVLFKPTDLISDYVWLRPYVGAGFAMYRSSLTSPTLGLAASDNQTGFQFFGGVEFTAASYPTVGLSVDLGYRTFDAPFTGYDLGHASFGISGHWYVK